jgi:lipopolysaccharide heptosyltransferase I
MRRILSVRLGALGDIIHALPAAAALRSAFPDARLDWLVESKHRAILDLVPILDTRFVINTRAFRGPQATLAVIRSLRRTRYDIAFDLQGLIKSAVLARASGARRIVGYATRHLREAGARAFYSEQIDFDASAAPHVIDKGLAILQAVGLGGPVGDGGSHAASDNVANQSGASGSRKAWGSQPLPRRFPLVQTESFVPASTRQLLGLWPDEPFALINPGAAWPNKRWPADRFGALAREIRTRHGLRSAVVWGPGEETLAAQVVAASSGAAEMAPVSGLADLLALARAARLLISGDTGPIHLAAAVGTPVVGIYGPTDPRRNGPWSAADRTVSRFERCACHHQRRCRVAAWCLADIALAEVLEAVERRLTTLTTTAS